MALSLTFNPFSGKFDYIDLPSGTINEIAYFSAANTISSLTVATYPSLTELSYVKGVSSDIQTQLDNLNTRVTNMQSSHNLYTYYNYR